ncbi:MFS transporter [Salinispora pacifica]|uniref:MFS transporter n=1 Tax=Salinispora pacifica TaxID=351187 RepID=UPI000382483C|nr:MFS transporter [Salinispora pacifica]
MGPWLVPLVLAMFAFGTGDFIVAGILRELAAEFSVSEALAGQLVTVYSVVYAVTAPVAAVVAARWSRRVLMIGAMSLFALSNVVAAMSESYSILMGTRVTSAIAAAAVTPLCFSAAGTIPPEDKRGKALGFIGGGLMLAMVLGVPLGTWVGGQYGWRAAFWFVAASGLLVLVGMVTMLPALPVSAGGTLRERLTPLANGSIVRGLACMLIVSAGGMMMLTYIAPVMFAAGGVTTDGIAVLFLAAGLAGVVATVIGGAGADRLGPPRMITLGATLLAASMLTLSAMIGWGDTPLALLVLLAVVWSLAIGTLNPPLQVWLISRSGPSANEVMALNSSAIYLGTSAGGLLGGLLLAQWGPILLPLVAAAEVVLVVILLMTASDRHVASSNEKPATETATSPA